MLSMTKKNNGHPSLESLADRQKNERHLENTELKLTKKRKETLKKQEDEGMA
jgi:hypothetical protein